MNNNNTATTNKEPRLLLSKLSKLGFLILFAVFVGVVIFCINISLNIPEAWVSTEATTWACDERVPHNGFEKSKCRGADISQYHSKVSMLLGPFSSLNQESRIVIIPTRLKDKMGISSQGKVSFVYRYFGSNEIKNPNEIKMKEVELIEEKTVTKNVVCKGTTNLCEEIPLISQIYLTHKYYILELSIKKSEIQLGDIHVQNSFVSSNYSIFELFWRMAFILFSSWCTMIYVWSLKGIPMSEWCHEQKWTFVLSLLLILYNNPFYFYELTVDDDVTFLLYNSAIEMLFMCYMLFYALSMFEALRKPISVRRSWRFIIPRGILTGLMFIFGFAHLMYNKTNPNYSISLTGIEDPTNLGLIITLTVIIAVYIFWLAFGIIRTYSESKKLGPVASRLKYYGLFTVVVVIMYVVLYLASGYLGYHTNAAVTLTTIAFVNMYVVMLNILYLPLEKDDDSILVEQNNKKQEIHLDNEEIFDDEFVVVDEENEGDLIIIE